MPTRALKRRGSGEKDYKWRSVKYHERRANIEKRPCQGNVKVAAGVFWTKRGKRVGSRSFSDKIRQKEKGTYITGSLSC